MSLFISKVNSIWSEFRRTLATFLLFCHVPLTWSAWNISLVEHILPRHSHQVLMRCTVIGPKLRYLFLLVYVLFQMTTAVSANILGLSETQTYDSLAASLNSFLFCFSCIFLLCISWPIYHARLLLLLLLLE